ncbi:MAG: hypothetical protein GXO27_00605 [Chlorobi bacterium]|nr:hypothetical protein [Chlorobiota bacterium]
MKRITLLAGALLLTFSLRAQSLVDTAKADLNRYLQAYAAPLFEANLYNFSGGWSHGAKPLKPFRLKIDLTGTYTFVPADRQSFVFDPADYQYLTVLDSSGNEITGPVSMPTFAGDKTDKKLRIRIPGSVPGTYNEVIFKAPPGFREELEEWLEGLPVGIPGLMAQLRMGLPFKTEVAVRYIPKITYGPVSAHLFGAGLKHEIGHYFLDSTKWHIALAGAFSRGQITATVPEFPDFTGVFMLETYTAKAFVSYDMKFLSFYGAAGWVRGESRLDVVGSTTYTYDVVDSGGHVIGSATETVTDPLSLRYTMDAPVGLAGVLLNLKFLHIFAQYNFGTYSGIHAGISLTY